VVNLRRRRQGGQAVLIVVVAIGLLMIGAMGLAIDTGQLYGHRQMAQAAADSVAQAAILSIYSGTNTGSNTFGGSSFTCTNGTDARSPCAYARLNGFATTGSADTIDIDFPGTVSGVILSPAFTPAAAHVVITRPVNTTLLRLLGAGASKSIKAAATAAITDIVMAVPIVVTHPTLSGAFSLSGNSTIQICGGPSQSLQVNSGSLTSLSVGGSATVDISHAGPADTLGDCTLGTGGDFGAFGGPRTPNPPTWLTPIGSTEQFYAPNPPIPDPYRNVPYPTDPGAPTQGPTIQAIGTGSCPATLPNGSANPNDCKVYWPGNYPNGISAQGETAVFNPGIYYISGTGSGPFNGIGFGNAANGNMVMCATGCTPAPGCCDNGGMLVYLTENGGTVAVGANSGAWLLGSDRSSTETYLGLLFFGNRSLPAATGASSHSLGGGGDISLQGTIYFTNTNMTSATYQNVKLRGNSGNTTRVQGDIVVSALDLGGGGSIRMQLSPLGILTIPQVALVN
jgi:hypothetical protein